MGDTLVSDPDGLHAEISRLISGQHDNPHRLLGRHEDGGNMVVRALRPTAKAMRVLVAGAALDGNADFV